MVDGVRAPEDDLASQFAAKAYWDRKERVLDNVKDPAKPMDSVRSLIASASPSGIAPELPDYLSSRNVQSSDWLQGAIAERVASSLDKARRAGAAVAAMHHGFSWCCREACAAAPALACPVPIRQSDWGSHV